MSFPNSSPLSPSPGWGDDGDWPEESVGHDFDDTVEVEEADASGNSSAAGGAASLSLQAVVQPDFTTLNCRALLLRVVAMQVQCVPLVVEGKRQR
jgi:hypothetical protein